jgi:antitoxin CptB
VSESESREVRLRRLTMRSCRRGIREMDLILGAFAAEALAGLDPTGLDAYEALLEENDQDLLAWVIGQAPPPPAHAALIGRIAASAVPVARSSR